MRHFVAPFLFLASAVACGPSGTRVPAVAGPADAGGGTGGTGLRDASRGDAPRPDAPIAGSGGGTPDAAVVIDVPASLDSDLAPDLRPPPPDLRPADVRLPPQTPPAPVLNDGLIAYWPMDDGAGDVARDATANGLHARVKTGSIAWVDGKHSWALHIRNGGYLQVDDPAALAQVAASNAVTVAAWVQPIKVDPVNFSFFAHRQEADTSLDWFGLGFRAGVPAFILHFMVAAPQCQAQATDAACVVPVSPLNKWVHVAGTYDGVTIRVYVDGEEAGTNDEVLTFPDGQNKPILLGAATNANGVVKEFFEGYVDDLRIYRRALTAAEIKTLAN